MSSSAPDRLARAAKRAETMSIRKGTSGGTEVDFSPVRGVQAISLAAQLSREAFSLAGVEAPSYERAQIPVRFVSRKRA